MTRPDWLLKVAAAICVLLVVSPLRTFWRSIRRRHRVRIFTFHRVSHLCRDGMTVRPSAFRRQIAAIRRTHRIVGIDEATALVASGTRLAWPVAAITFDDAYRSVATNAAPMLARDGIPATVFVSTAIVGMGSRFAHDEDSPVRDYLEVMSWEELAALRYSGWRIGAHTATHARLSRCDATALERELAHSIPVLQARTGDQSFPFAYPFGGERDITPFARHLVERLGYTCCLSDFGGENDPPCEPYSLRRIELGGDHASLAWRVRVHGLDLAAWRPSWLRGPQDRGAVRVA